MSGKGPLSLTTMKPRTNPGASGIKSQQQKQPSSNQPVHSTTTSLKGPIGQYCAQQEMAKTIPERPNLQMGQQQQHHDDDLSDSDLSFSDDGSIVSEFGKTVENSILKKIIKKREDPSYALTMEHNRVKMKLQKLEKKKEKLDDQREIYKEWQEELKKEFQKLDEDQKAYEQELEEFQRRKQSDEEQLKQKQNEVAERKRQVEEDEKELKKNLQIEQQQRENIRHEVEQMQNICLDFVKNLQTLLD